MPKRYDIEVSADKAREIFIKILSKIETNSFKEVQSPEYVKRRLIYYSKKANYKIIAWKIFNRHLSNEDFKKRSYINGQEIIYRIISSVAKKQSFGLYESQFQDLQGFIGRIVLDSGQDDKLSVFDKKTAAKYFSIYANLDSLLNDPKSKLTVDDLIALFMDYKEKYLEQFEFYYYHYFSHYGYEGSLFRSKLRSEIEMNFNKQIDSLLKMSREGKATEIDKNSFREILDSYRELRETLDVETDED